MITGSSDESNSHSNVTPDDSAAFDTMHELLIKKLKLAQDKIEACHVIENNNPETVIEKMTDKEFMKAKTTYIKALNEQVKNLTPSGYPHHPNLVSVEFVKNLTKEIEDLKALREAKKIQLNSTLSSISNLQKEIDTLRQIRKSREEKGEMNEEADLVAVHEDIKRQHAKIKTYFKRVLDLVFPDDPSVHSILKKLWTNFFSGDDGQYVKFESKWNAHLEFLVTAGIAIAHPHDKEKYKLATFI